MCKKFVAAVALVAGLSGTADAQDAKAVLSAAAKVMGADSLNTIEYSATGFDFFLGQSYSPSSPWPKFINKIYTRAIDFQVPASRVVRVRMQGEDPPRGGGNQPLRGEQTQAQVIIVNADTPWNQQLEIWMTPHGFLKAAAARNATVASQTSGGKKSDVLTFTGQNGARVNGYIDDQHLVERVETWIDNAMLGDMHFEAAYSDYKDYGSVKFPARIILRQGGHPTFDLTVTDVRPNVPVDIRPQSGPAQAGVAGAGAAGGQAGGVPSEKLADGVYAVLGGSLGLVVEFKDHVVVIEGPQNEARADAIITETRRLIPSKPIRYVVNTHHHFDHAGGIRTFAAEGATIVTHEINRPYFEKIFGAPRTISPDKLAKSGRKPTYETMTEKKVLTDGNQVIELYHLQGSGHNPGLIVAYLPKHKFLVEADAYNPPPAPDPARPPEINPFNVNLVENIERLKLDIERIIPVHYPADRRSVTMAELMRAVGRAK